MLGKWLSATSSRSLPVLRREQGSFFKSMLRANRHSFGWNHDGDATFRATTICSVRKDGMVAVVGDGQVSMGSTIAKPNAKKVRRVNTGKSEILVGFAGGTADAGVDGQRSDPRDRATLVFVLAALVAESPSLIVAV